jgi:predicted RNA methylase
MVGRLSQLRRRPAKRREVADRRRASSCTVLALDVRPRRGNDADRLDVTEPPSWDELAALARSDDLGDRAFAAGALRLRWWRDRGADRVKAAQLLEALRAHALERHADVRAAIQSGALRGAALRARLESIDETLRDSWIEEVLDVASPPMEEPVYERGLVPYVPSGVAEILHAVDASGTGPGHTLVDLGSGMGKVVLLASLVSGARGLGIELDPTLANASRAAARALDLDRVRIVKDDARHADLDGGDVFFMYLPFTGAPFEAVMQRIERVARTKKVVICAVAVDVRRFGWLRERAGASSWMQVYESAEI